jgi:regulatory protein
VTDGVGSRELCSKELCSQEHSSKEFLQAYNDAVRYLSYRARSRSEVVRKLTEREYKNGDIDAVIAELESGGYIDDEKFCRLYISDKTRLNGYGPKRIRDGLMQLGVDRFIIDECLNSYKEETEDSETALGLLRKKYRNGFPQKDDPGYLKEKKKAVDFLLRKGYYLEAAVQSLKALCGDD